MLKEQNSAYTPPRNTIGDGSSKGPVAGSILGEKRTRHRGHGGHRERRRGVSRRCTQM